MIISTGKEAWARLCPSKIMIDSWYLDKKGERNGYPPEQGRDKQKSWVGDRHGE